MVTVIDSNFIAEIDECIDSRGTANEFSTFDANRGYSQIELDMHDKDRTALFTHSGLYRFIWLPFGLKSASATFQRTMDNTLVPLKWQHGLLNSKKVKMFSKITEKHLNHVEPILQHFEIAGETLKPKKSLSLFCRKKLLWARNNGKTVA